MFCGHQGHRAAPRYAACQVPDRRPQPAARRTRSGRRTTGPGEERHLTRGMPHTLRVDGGVQFNPTVCLAASEKVFSVRIPLLIAGIRIK